MAYNGRYSIAIRILLLKKYLEANAGRNRYVRPQEIHDFLKEYELDVEKKALYADFAVLGDIFGLQLEYDQHKKGYRLLNPPFPGISRYCKRRYGCSCNQGLSAIHFKWNVVVTWY